MTRVVVFEDEASCQEIARRALNRYGISDIVFAVDGATGLRALDRMEPKADLVICDIFMPEGDGIEIVNALVERQFKGGLILVSGKDGQFLQIAMAIATKAGLNVLGALLKPLRDEALADALKLLRT